MREAAFAQLQTFFVIALAEASDRTLRWVLSYIRWMHVYPFGHDQNGWDAFLGHSIQFEPFVAWLQQLHHLRIRMAFAPLAAPLGANEVPTSHDISLRVLDTGKEFLTLTGWAGSLPAAFPSVLLRAYPHPFR